MIQFNLLPDVKLQYIKARYRKRLVVGASIIISASFLTIFVLLFLLVRVQQKHEMKSITKDITTSSKELTQITDLNKILTIQNQLDSLPELHDKKVISSRLFEYLSQLTPTQATISNVDIDFALNTISIKGNANELSTVNKFADTLKFTTYKALPTNSKEEPKEGKAFSKVELASFTVAALSTPGRDASNSATYELIFSFDPIIFANIKAAPTDASITATLADPNADPNANPVASVEKPVILIVPKIITTRSEVEKPNNLFVPQPAPPNSEGR